MALARAAYLEHLRAILRRALQEPDDADVLLRILIRAGVAYVRAGGTAQERADRREAVRIWLTAAWQVLGRTHVAHDLKHAMASALANTDDAEDVPNIPEPTT